MGNTLMNRSLRLTRRLVSNNVTQKAPTQHPDYIGLHCHRWDLLESPWDGDGLGGSNSYASSYFREIIESLPYTLIDKYPVLREEPPDPYSDEFESWAESVETLLDTHQIRWVFVSGNRPLHQQYGNFCYYVLLPEKAVLNVIDDAGG